ncbi:MAG: hypothetical protein KDA92_08135 [Planctomycetales bacterium]|nr:hypothetical protein [Planctomycetales bacterium]MCA9171092.1 hypothetical protein [Planctomycetales bacterium]
MTLRHVLACTFADDEVVIWRARCADPHGRLRIALTVDGFYLLRLTLEQELCRKINS